jgi:protein ImuA
LNSSPIKAARPPSDNPAVWAASELAASQGGHVPTGNRALDAQLPGGGWPLGALVEVLQMQEQGPGGVHSEWRLLLPALVKTSGVLVLVGAPHAPFAPGLAGQGLGVQRLLCVNTATPASRLWATEQALRCKDVAAVLAWLPQARADALRRLQISAATHRKLLFVMRPVEAQAESSPAVLRLMATNAQEGDGLQVHILKRRGPPLEQALTLAARPARLSALLAAQAMQQAQIREQMHAPAKEQAPFPAAANQDTAADTPAPLAELLNFPVERTHDALDRIAIAA